MSIHPTLEVGHILVQDVMHHGIIEVDRDAPISLVAELMAARRVHAVAVVNPDGPDVVWKVVSALDVVAGIRANAESAAKDVAATELLTISSGERLDRAVQLMSEHELSHLIVTDRASGKPTGILSTLDILAAVAR